jgi:hypothetical protein
MLLEELGESWDRDIKRVGSIVLLDTVEVSCARDSL